MLPLQVLFTPFPFAILILELPDIVGEKILTAAPSPSHFFMDTQQCLYPSLVASCYGILLFCKTAGLCSHIRPLTTHSFTALNHAAWYWPTFTWRSPLHFKIFTYLPSRSSLTYKDSYYHSRASRARVFMSLPCLLFPRFTPLLSLLPVFSSSHLLNFQTELPPCAKASGTWKWMNDGQSLPSRRHSELFWGNLWKASSTGHGIGA